MTTDTETAPAATTTPEPKERKVSMRSILMNALRAGETDNQKLVALVQATFPEIAEKRILSSLAVHRSVLRKEATAAAAAKVAGT